MTARSASGPDAAEPASGAPNRTDGAPSPTVAAPDPDAHMIDLSGLRTTATLRDIARVRAALARGTGPDFARESFRGLARSVAPDGRISAARMWRCAAIHGLAERLPWILESRWLRPSHVGEVLALPCPEQDRLLEHERWTVRQLRHEIRSARSAPQSTARPLAPARAVLADARALVATLSAGDVALIRDEADEIRVCLERATRCVQAACERIPRVRPVPTPQRSPDAVFRRRNNGIWTACRSPRVHRPHLRGRRPNSWSQPRSRQIQCGGRTRNRDGAAAETRVPRIDVPLRAGHDPLSPTWGVSRRTRCRGNRVRSRRRPPALRKRRRKTVSAAWSRRRLRSGLFVPPEACGLIDAVSEACGGHDALLFRWEREARPALARVLASAGLDPASADDAMVHLLEQALDAVRAGRQVVCEPAWMRSVLANARARTYRNAARERRRHEIVAARIAATEHRADVEMLDLRADLLAAASRLPPRFARAIRLRLRGMAPGEVRSVLAAEFGVGLEMARKIDARAVALLRSALTGRLARGA